MPAMQVKALPDCSFCGARGAGRLLCDGRISTGEQLTHVKTCDRVMCRSCAGDPVLNIHLKTRSGGRWDTRDLCPECRSAGRSER